MLMYGALEEWSEVYCFLLGLTVQSYTVSEEEISSNHL